MLFAMSNLSGDMSMALANHALQQNSTCSSKRLTIGSEVRSVESRLKAVERAVFHKLRILDQPQTPEAIEDGTISRTTTWIEADAGTAHGPRYISG